MLQKIRNNHKNVKNGKINKQFERTAGKKKQGIHFTNANTNSEKA